MKRVNQGLSLVMSLLLCVTSFNFSLIARANEQDAARIIGFNQLDESIATQNLSVGASLSDVVFPDSLKATVETVEQVEVRKPIEKESVGETEELEEEVVEGEVVSKDTTEEDVSDGESDEPEREVTDEIVEPETSSEESVVDETAPVENIEEEADPEQSEQPESVDIGLIDILFPPMVAKAAELDENSPSTLAGVTVAVADSMPEIEYETVVETKTVQSEITIENVKWEIADGTSFATSKAATYTFTPVFNADYVVATAVPTIKVNIINADSKIGFDKSVAVDGVRISVKADAGVFPEEAMLSVEKVYGTDLQAVEAAVEEERADDKNKVESYTFDIKVLDKNGSEIEPDNSKGQVKVSFTLEEVADVNLETDVYHVKGEVGDLSVDKLEATETATTTVEAVTDGFSFYTVEFTYNNLQYVMNGDTTVALADILDYVGLQGTVTNAVSDAPELFTVANTESGWIVKANRAFTTEQKLIVTIGGKEYVIVVTDDVSPYASLKNSTTVITFDGKAWYLIDYDSSTVTLLSKDCVAASQYDSNGTSNTYSGSTVETAVNNYYTNSISSDVKSAIVDGKMFLLTTAQVNAMTADTRKCTQYSGSDLNVWWLCSPVDRYNAACADGGYGTVIVDGIYVGRTLGVRPALKLDLSKVTFYSASNTFRVDEAGPVASITLNQTAVTMSEGEAIKLIATVSPDDASNKTVQWTTSNGKVATVSEGVVTAIQEGTVTITATATNGTEDTSDDITATCTVTVLAPTYDISISPSQHGSVTTSVSSAKAGEMVNITAMPDENYKLKSITGIYHETTKETFYASSWRTSFEGTYFKYQCGNISAVNFKLDNQGVAFRLNSGGGYSPRKLEISSIDGETKIDKIVMTATGTDGKDTRNNDMLQTTAGTFVFDNNNPSAVVIIKDINSSTVTVSCPEAVFDYENNSDQEWYVTSITVYSSNVTEKDIMFTDTGKENVYSFEMPADPVTIFAEFEQKGASSDSKGNADATIVIPDGVETSVTGDKPNVNGLSDKASELAKDKGKDVTLKLVVEPKGQSKATESEILKNNEDMHNSVKILFKDEETVSVDVLDINIQQIIDGENTGNLSEPGTVVEIGIHYDFTNKYDPTIVRNHNGVSTTFVEYATRPSSGYQDGHFYVDRSANMLYIYSDKFSDYVIAYSTVEGNAQNRTVASSGGSSSGTSSPSTVSVYRLFNTKTGDHLYTTSKEEQDILLENYVEDGWTDEGIAFETAVKTDIPVYRVFDIVNGLHLYTTDTSVRDAYVANGYRDEGIAWYSSVAGGRKVYKLTQEKTGKVTYTTSKEEADALIEAGFTCEEAEFVVY